MVKLEILEGTVQFFLISIENDGSAPTLSAMGRLIPEKEVGDYSRRKF